MEQITSIANGVIPSFSFDIKNLSPTTILIIVSIIALFAIGIVYYRIQKQKKGNVVANIATDGKRVMKMHRLYRSMPVLNKYYEKTYKTIQQMYPTDTFTVIQKTVDTVTRGFIIFSAIVFGIVLISGFNILYMLTGILVAYVLMSNSISKKLQTQDKLIKMEFQDFLETFRYYYNETGAVDSALDLSLEECPPELALHIQKIYDVVTSTDIDNATEKYTQQPNDKFFLMFCSICSTITKQGDRPLADGVTVLLNNVKHLQEELNIEILKIKLKEILFKGVIPISMIPVLALKPIEIWSRTNMTDIAPYFDGAYGTVTMFLIFFIAIYASNKIDNLKNGGGEENVKLWNYIANLPGFRTYLKHKQYENWSKVQKLETSMKKMGVPMTANSFYAKKYAFAAMCAILANVVILLSNYSEKTNLLNDYAESFQTTYATDEAYTQILVDTAQEMTKYHLKDKNVTVEDLNKMVYEEIVSKGTIQKVADAQQVTQEVVNRITKYKGIYYQWYYVLITILAALIGYRLPDKMLKNRQKAMEMDMEDEIIQFQSIALIMMHIKEATVENTLEWMEKFAKCFKGSITECLLNIDSGETLALQAMKDAEPNPQFQKIVNSLLSVDRVGMEDAFDSVEVERKFLRDKRQKDNEEIINKKSRDAWKMVFLMLFSVIGLWLIGPMLMMGMSMLSQLTTMMNI